jgi:hypothetical protein
MFAIMLKTLVFCRDAWSLGAVDPTSGTATLLEITRALGEMYKNGIYLYSYLINSKTDICISDRISTTT